jgi:hypothetical protein
MGVLRNGDIHPQGGLGECATGRKRKKARNRKTDDLTTVHVSLSLMIMPASLELPMHGGF